MISSDKKRIPYALFFCQSLANWIEIAITYKHTRTRVLVCVGKTKGATAANAMINKLSFVSVVSTAESGWRWCKAHHVNNNNDVQTQKFLLIHTRTHTVPHNTESIFTLDLRLAACLKILLDYSRNLNNLRRVA